MGSTTEGKDVKETSRDDYRKGRWPIDRCSRQALCHLRLHISPFLRVVEPTPTDHVSRTRQDLHRPSDPPQTSLVLSRPGPPTGLQTLTFLSVTSFVVSLSPTRLDPTLLPGPPPPSLSPDRGSCPSIGSLDPNDRTRLPAPSPVPVPSRGPLASPPSHLRLWRRQ